MAHFENRNNELTLIDEYLILKITTNREIYYKLKNDQMFKMLVDKKVPLGFNVEDKKAVLMQLNEKILSNYGNDIDAKVNGDENKDMEVK